MAFSIPPNTRIVSGSVRKNTPVAFLTPSRPQAAISFKAVSDRSNSSSKFETRNHSPKPQFPLQSNFMTSRSSPIIPSSTDRVYSSTSTKQSMICVSVTATNIPDFVEEIKEACACGADIVELRVDFLNAFNPEIDLPKLMKTCTLPYIVTYRPVWEGGLYRGPENSRLAALALACRNGAPFVDCEYKAVEAFSEVMRGVETSTKLILSYHDFEKTPPRAFLFSLATKMAAAGADIVKISTMARDISDAAVTLALLKEHAVGDKPLIALSMGAKGQISRLLAGKYGAFLTFAAMDERRASAPGQPHVALLRELFRLSSQTGATKCFGIVGNPVEHSRSPLIHNTAFQNRGFDGVYVPLLVDDFARFWAALGEEFEGISVTIPHKEAALRMADEADPIAAQIGAANTLVRVPPSSCTAASPVSRSTFRASNTDWLAAIEAIERALSPPTTTSATTTRATTRATVDPASPPPPHPSSVSPLAGRKVVVLGAGGAGRALAFGAAAKGANVIVANRNQQRAEELVASLRRIRPLANAEVADLKDVVSGKVSGDVLANTTSVGMNAVEVAAGVPNGGESPVSPEAVGKYKVVFDAVYTPLNTPMLLEARRRGVLGVDGLQMFLGQAAEQFKLFTGGIEPPMELMRDVVLKSLSKSHK